MNKTFGSADYVRPINPLLLTDFYKICHKSLYNPGTENLVSYWTPRKSRLPGINKVVMFGLQAYIKKYLIGYFNRFFFDAPWAELESEFLEVIGATLSPEIAKTEIAAFKELYALGYLPISIRALPEGTLAPIGCPMIEFKATDKRFFWLINYLETLSSCNLWYPMTTATIAYASRAIIDNWYDKTVDDGVPRCSAAGDFSMRGMTSLESAPMADAGHLLSFTSTATVPTLSWLHTYYNAPYTSVRGTPSTEHSVMESYLVENEFEAYRHLIEDVMPSGVLSMVSDTWNLWTVITEYLPKLKNSIMARDGKIVIRPDSGNPADILCGKVFEVAEADVDPENDEAIKAYFKKVAEDKQDGDYPGFNFQKRIGDYLVEAYCDFAPTGIGLAFEYHVDEIEIRKRRLTPEEKGVIELLWDVFGGTMNSKGYHVLDKHIGAIYGDAITHQSCDEICARLAAKGFAANNLVFGYGSYTYQYVTRDTLGFALKVTSGTIDGKEVPMFKDPVTDRGPGGASKKSQKGMCIVLADVNGNLAYTDGHTERETEEELNNMLRPVLTDGVLLVDDDFDDVRNRLHERF